MEQLDKKMYASKQPVKLSDDLAAKIMDKIRLMPTPKKHSIQWSRQSYIWASAPILLLSILAISFLSTSTSSSSAGHSVINPKSTSKTTANSSEPNNLADSNKANGSQSNTNKTASSSNATDNGSVANGTDNASLDSDMNNIANSLNENDQSFAAVTNAINSQQLDTPTSD